MKSIQTSLNHYILEPALKKFGELGAVYLSCKLIDLVYPKSEPVQIEKMLGSSAFRCIQMQLGKPGCPPELKNFVDEPVQIEKVLESFVFHFIRMQLKKSDCPPQLKNFVDEYEGANELLEAALVGKDSTQADSL